MNLFKKSERNNRKRAKCKTQSGVDSNHCCPVSNQGILATKLPLQTVIIGTFYALLYKILAESKTNCCFRPLSYLPKSI